LQNKSNYWCTSRSWKQKRISKGKLMPSLQKWKLKQKVYMKS
jgi:hypothetical protein